MGSIRIIGNIMETGNIEIDCSVPIWEIYEYILLCDFIRFLSSKYYSYFT